MSAGYERLSSSALLSIAAALSRGALSMAASRDQLQRLLSVEDADAIDRLLTALKNAKMDRDQAAVTLRLLADSRKAQESLPKPQLVWSDLDVRGSRDTSVVAHELFRSAQRYVLVSTYNLGHKRREGEAPGHPLLRPLAERMAQLPKLRVRLFCNLKRMPWQKEANQEQVVADFARWFQAELWPWSRLPELYFDPRSLSPQKDVDAAKDTACLHAKCILIDDEQAFVTSANLTTAAQSRNIEAGALLRFRLSPVCGRDKESGCYVKELAIVEVVDPCVPRFVCEECMTR